LQFGDAHCAVTAVAGDQRGERLIVLYSHSELGPGDLRQRLANTDLPRLWLPKRENFSAVEALPLLGTGKIDMRGVRGARVRISIR
jgi:acyl-[acyl-carrier-protein]-phospholipid O-acyltransferase/long-chain-fatty-acid--[acyl-carrier-protein] ligase